MAAVTSPQSGSPDPRQEQFTLSGTCCESLVVGRRDRRLSVALGNWTRLRHADLPGKGPRVGSSRSYRVWATTRYSRRPRERVEDVAEPLRAHRDGAAQISTNIKSGASTSSQCLSASDMPRARPRRPVVHA